MEEEAVFGRFPVRGIWSLVEAYLGSSTLRLDFQATELARFSDARQVARPPSAANCSLVLSGQTASVRAAVDVPRGQPLLVNFGSRLWGSPRLTEPLKRLVLLWAHSRPDPSLPFSAHQVTFHPLRSDRFLVVAC
jgi:hypothetical protein